MKQMLEMLNLQAQKLVVIAQTASNSKVWSLVAVVAVIAQVGLNGDPGGAWGR